MRSSYSLCLQEGAFDCGAACLHMILNAHGKAGSYAETLSDLMGGVKKGIDALSLVNYARGKGVSAKGFAGPIEKIPPGSIIFWREAHFVIFEGLNGGKTYVIDPAIGRASYPKDEAQLLYQGMFIAFDAPKPIRRPLAAWRSFHFENVSDTMRIILGGKLPWILVFVGSLLSALLAVIFPFVVARYSESAGNPKNSTIILLVFLSFAACVASLAQKHGATLIETSATSSVVRFTLHKIIDASPAVSLRWTPNEALSALYNSDAAKQAIRDGTTGALAQGIVSMLLLFIIMLINPLMFLIVAVVIFLETGFLAVLWDKLIRAHTTDLGERLHTQAALADLCRKLEEVKTWRIEGSANALADSLIDREKRIRVAARKDLTLFGSVMDGIGVSVPIFVLVAGAHFSSSHRFTSLVISILTYTCLTNMRGTFDTLSSIGALLPIARRLRRLAELPVGSLELGREQMEVKQTSSLDDWKFTTNDDILTLIGVSHRFGANDWLFKNVNFTVRKNDFLLLTGPSGSGKSTLARICAGLVGPTTGTVIWHPREGDARDVLYLPAAPRLLDLPIRLLLDPSRSFDDGRILAVLSACEIVKKIGERPADWSRKLGVAGINLSAGELQRFNLARALLVEPRILILDEAVNALPEEHERRVLSLVHERCESVLLVTHRPANVPFATHRIDLYRTERDELK